MQQPRIYALYVDDLAKKCLIASQLNSDAIASKSGQPWTTAIVDSILTNIKCTGPLVFLGHVPPLKHIKVLPAVLIVRSCRLPITEARMAEGTTANTYRGYSIDVTRRREDDLRWRAHFRVRGKLGTVHRGDSATHDNFLVAEAEAYALGRRHIDALVDEVSLAASASQWTLPIR